MMLVRRPVGAYGVPVQYERSFRWKLGQFRYLCSVSHTDRFRLEVTDRQTDTHLMASVPGQPGPYVNHLHLAPDR